MKKTPYHLKDFIWSSHTTIASMLEGSKSQKILDIGCDNGFIGSCLKYSPKKLVGLDKRKVLKLPKKYHQFINFDLELGLDENTIKDKFDTIILADILEHVQKPHQIINQTKTLLEKNNYIIISIPNMDFLLVKIFKIFKFRPKMNSGLFDKTHLHDFTYSKLVNLLSKNKLTIEQVAFLPVPLPLISQLFNSHQKLHSLYRLLYHLTKMFPKVLSYQVVVKTRINHT